MSEKKSIFKASNIFFAIMVIFLLSYLYDLDKFVMSILSDNVNFPKTSAKANIFAIGFAVFSLAIGIFLAVYLVRRERQGRQDSIIENSKPEKIHDDRA